MNNFWASLSLFFLSIIFGVVGYLLKRRVEKFKKEGIKTLSNVVDFKVERGIEINQDGSGQDLLTFYPIVEFRNENREPIRQKLMAGSSRKPKMDSKISIYYIKKDNGYKILVDSKFWNVYVSIIFYAICGILFAFGTFLLF